MGVTNIHITGGGTTANNIHIPWIFRSFPIVSRFAPLYPYANTIFVSKILLL